MKIVLWPTLSVPNIGGIEVMTHTLAKQLQKSGHDVIIISNHLNSEECQEITIDGVTIHMFPFVTALSNHNLVTIKNTLQQIHKLLDAFEPDLVNIHGWFECFAFYQTRLFEKRQTPFCITIHGLLEQKHYRTRDCVKLWSMASAVNTVSQALMHSLKNTHFTHKKFKVIHNALPKTTVPLTPLSTIRPKLLMVGRLSEEKCFDVAFYALKKLLHKYPEIQLTLVGGGIKFSELFELRSHLELEANIEMTDFVRPHLVQTYIDQANLILVPSYYESFGLVALEAAMRARPVVASRVDGLEEVVEHQTSGILVPPRNPQALADAIDELLSDPQKMKNMGNTAYNRAVKLFDIENTTQKYLEMYASL